MDGSQGSGTSAPTTTTQGNAQQKPGGNPQAPRQQGNGQQQQGAPNPGQQRQNQTASNPLTQAARAVDKYATPPKPSLEERFSGVEESDGPAWNEEPEESQTTTEETSDQVESTDESFEERLKNHKEKIKVSGKEIEVTFEQLKKLASQGGRMFQAMEEAASHRKARDSYESIFQTIATDPDAFLEFGRRLNPDIDQEIEKRVYDRLKLQLMPDHERVAHEREEKLRRYEQREEQENQSKAEKDKERATHQAAERVQGEVLEHFKSLPDRVPVDLLARTLEIMLGSVGSPNGRLPVAKAYQIAQNQFKQSQSSRLKDLKPEDLPPELIEQIRQRELSKFRTQPQGSSAPRSERPPEPKRSRREPMSVDGLFKSLEDKYNK